LTVTPLRAILCLLVPLPALAQPVQPNRCEGPIAEWRAERDFGKKSLLFQRMADECKELLYAPSTPGPEEASVAAESEDVRSAPLGAYVRGDIALNGPAGSLSIHGGKQFLGNNAIELGVGRGSAARFASVFYRRLTKADGWHVAFGVGASIGISSNSGYDPDQHDEDPTTTTTWAHGEIAAQRLGRGVVVLAAFGLDAMMSGKYHVDFGDISVIDREPYSIAPYVRFGLGGGF